ncbi:uncharacterized protein [Dysidea avara]|uniref:uncharacterized protein n=1 Tax=Dysidea avara TaxID=196820 RepID=UPI0033186D84
MFKFTHLGHLVILVYPLAVECDHGTYVRPCKNKDTGVMNFSACWIVSSDIETGVFGVATDVPGLGIECHKFQVSLLRCIEYSVDGFKQISSVDCSGIKGVNF